MFWAKYAKKYWKMFVLAVLFLVTEAICDLLQPTVLARIVDIGVANRDMDYVLRMGGIMLIITAIGAIGAVGRNIMSSNVSQRLGAELRSDLFKKVNSLSFADLGQFETASLITRLTNDVTQIQEFVHRTMRIFVKAPILSLGGIAMAIYLNPSMTVVLMVVVPVVALLIALNLKIGYPLFARVQKSLDRLNGVMREYLAGVRVVKAFNRFEHETTRFNSANSALVAVTKTAMRVMAVFAPGITLAVNLGIVAVLWFGGWLVQAGQMEVGKIMAFINYMTQILHSLMMISMVFNMFVRARASTNRVGEVFRQENTMMTPEPALKPTKISEIEFADGSFSYTGRSTDAVLHQITFRCTQGETIGIIGSTGAGKTTLVNLIPRFHDATSGEVRINGVDVRHIDPKALRALIAVVPQKTLLFTGTIADNIRWGRENASQEEVKAAAEAAQADEFISHTEHGYDSVLGQAGVNVSGGQKQRIAIARALVRNPDVLILDDSTSAVDTITERQLREALREYSSDLICIIIAQRITSVLTTDRILVLDEGKLVGLGTHEMLSENCPVYQDIYRSQIGREAV